MMNNDNNNNDYNYNEANGVMANVKEKFDVFVITAELTDWVLIEAFISLTVQLIMKLVENVVLDCITTA